MALETISPESAYATKPNIVIPKTDPRTAAAVALVATDHSQLSLNYGDGPRSAVDADLVLPVLGNYQAITAVAATNVITGTSHGYSVGDALRCVVEGDGVGLVLNTTYFVLTVPDANTFTVSGTYGGTVLDITTDYTTTTGLVKIGYIGVGGNDTFVTYGSPDKEP